MKALCNECYAEVSLAIVIPNKLVAMQLDYRELLQPALSKC